MISKYFVKKVLFNFTYMMSVIDLMAISVETLMIDSWYFSKKEFVELICIDLWVNLKVNQVNLFHGCLCGHFILDSWDIS